MPSEPIAEPTLEELSCYLDHELDASTEARVAEHVMGCAGCKARLDGLRQAAYAIRALPMEKPTRTFTFPEKRPTAFRWAPVGWVGSAAAAVLVIGFGLSQLHFHPASTSTAGSSNFHKSTAPAASQGQILDSSRAGSASQAFNPYANTTTVVDPLNPARTLTLSTTAKSYAPDGVIMVHAQINGLAPEEVLQPRLLLERNGYAVELATPTHGRSLVPASFDISYDLARLPLSNPVDGSYTLILIESLPAPASGSGSTLVARLSITIGG